MTLIQNLITIIRNMLNIRNRITLTKGTIKARVAIIMGITSIMCRSLKKILYITNRDNSCSYHVSYDSNVYGN